jgi:hypothetical protein
VGARIQITLVPLMGLLGIGTSMTATFFVLKIIGPIPVT